jgi:MoaA/NifB/PqqE/SkfB family radical SAM enzyme
MDLSRLQLRPHKLFHHLDRVTAWKNGEYFPPIFIEFSPTDRCNQRCWFCYTNYLGHRKLDIGPAEMVRVFRDLGQAGVRAVQIQGTGEPLLNSATPDAIVAGHEAGLSLALCSNGVLLDDAITERIIPHLEWIRFSAFESTAERYARTHGCPEAQWHKLVHNIRETVRIREKLSTGTVIGVMVVLFPYNALHLLETVRMLKGFGVDFVHIKPPQVSIHNPDHDWPRGLNETFAEQVEQVLGLQDREFIVSYRKDQFEVEKAPGPFVKDFDTCHGLEFEALIDADYGVYPCLQFWRNPEFCYGNLKESSFDAIWRSDRRKEVQRKIYTEFDLNKCFCACKQSHLNSELCRLGNPPLHVNFL